MRAILAAIYALSIVGCFISWWIGVWSMVRLIRHRTAGVPWQAAANLFIVAFAPERFTTYGQVYRTRVMRGFTWFLFFWFAAAVSGAAAQFWTK
jgi:hypothetical protein